MGHDDLAETTSMNRSRRGLYLAAACAALASLGVLAMAGVGTGAFVIQSLTMLAAGAVALVGEFLGRRDAGSLPAVPFLMVALAGIAAPMLADGAGPDRWIAIGPLALYMAPVLMPAFLVVCSSLVDRPGDCGRLALVAIGAATMLLAAQPDASQALAVLVGSAVAVVRRARGARDAAVALLLAALATAWAFARPDPLQPVPHVEGVFRLSLAYSPLAGAAVIGSAMALVLALWRSGLHAGRGLAAVAAYYAVLYGCSVAGLTPAPLVGYGAGPWLGFGLMAGAVRWLEASGNRQT